MVQQLTVYDENGTQIGMTFPKRARQLISKQRAFWHDDSHTAIRLIPEIKEDIPMEEYLDDLDKPPMPTGSNDLLLYLAKKNVRDKRKLLKHFLAYIAAWPVIAIFYGAVVNYTAHSTRMRWNNVMRTFEDARIYLPPWRADNLERQMQTYFNNLTHPIMYIIIGVMIAWGVWILVRTVNHYSAARSRRLLKSKPDPVQVEYQRLKDMSGLRI